jgi:hypothetical protein
VRGPRCRTVAPFGGTATVDVTLPRPDVGAANKAVYGGYITLTPQAGQGLDQVLRARTIGASYGDAFLAALAVGDARKDDISQWNPVERTVSARAEHAAVHARQYRVFRQIYEQTRHLMAALSEPA